MKDWIYELVQTEIDYRFGHLARTASPRPRRSFAWLWRRPGTSNADTPHRISEVDTMTG